MLQTIKINVTHGDTVTTIEIPMDSEVFSHKIAAFQMENCHHNLDGIIWKADDKGCMHAEKDPIDNLGIIDLNDPERLAQYWGQDMIKGNFLNHQEWGFIFSLLGNANHELHLQRLASMIEKKTPKEELKKTADNFWLDRKSSL